ncbi:DUF4145 domain-containing protein [Vibrio parahaemolyticus]|uniref:DUF4145 domain-containing protein n=1 Tax=Vibrio parahaemolyticus TaxID=670 RepID=UPI000405ACCB|nr:DUF4145 domain-containing protein [Vibrio parahaemolyticus]KIT42008.1 hypothetical protein H331_23110 [Vibrio parahaemolyticus 3644]KIT56214.1 hypothetical protein H336_21570 [Vibrio parahaemolyticus EN9701072]EGQ8244515.1 DUF4145 domain-containing protein [Vibrio parahaemolyticus]EGQ8387743.1 DUF4145 domain-containing protein [Vibrio parahaemolyticus]EGQ9128095.1 DUF4145 domain-containing protein [Vibrio parahaemolyticus]
MTIPKLNEDKFKCLHCGVLSQQRWFSRQTVTRITSAILEHSYLDARSSISEYTERDLQSFMERYKNDLARNLRQYVPDNFSISMCASCNAETLWVNDIVVFPVANSIPEPNNDLNEDIKSIYLEAASILNNSPKGASALLRLALQMLLKQVGKSGKNINDDIKGLVSDGLSPKIQQALDILRVVGNNAVHPGAIDFQDSTDVALKLFQILNYIAEELITKPKELESLYNDIIPDETKRHIEQRDRKNT